MFEAFDNNRSRYASVGVVSSMPGELIDSVWYIIDFNLKGVFPLNNLLSFTIMDNKGSVTMGYTEAETDVDMTVDLPFRYVDGLPSEVQAYDDGTRETILLPREIKQR
ncbi:DUF960 domain-containing protein [Enterococcus sp. HY326]|uniref:DUF960 domain-containing protein n=1 Tax=Enterococcus sp. HY326 TaxID=2971265 RepID=UPI00223F6558|nr:DUF960 domain-containing protein [Enterococcus sp. HY326]